MNKKKAMTCPQCNAEVNPSDEFCSECGKILAFSESYDVISDEED